MAEQEKLTPEKIGAAFDNKPRRPLPENPIEGYRNGVCLDLRVRFAMELMVHAPNMAPLFNADGEIDAKLTAVTALDIATELYAEADARGLIEAIGDDIPESLKAHVRRQAAMQYEANKELGRLQEEGNRIRNAVGKAFNQ